MWPWSINFYLDCITSYQVSIPWWFPNPSQAPPSSGQHCWLNIIDSIPDALSEFIREIPFLRPVNDSACEQPNQWDVKKLLKVIQEKTQEVESLVLPAPDVIISGWQAWNSHSLLVPTPAWAWWWHRTDGRVQTERTWPWGFCINSP